MLGLTSKASRMATVAVIGTRGFPGVQGGVEMHSEHLYPLMQDVRFRVYRRKAYLSAASKKKTYPNIDFVDLPSSRIKGVEALLHTLLCVLHIAFHRPDAVHVHNMGPGMFIPVLKLLRLPVVMTYHSVNYEHAKWNGWQRRLLRWCEKLSLRYSDRIIFVNQFQMEKYDEQVRSKSIYIPNGIDTVTRSQSTSFLEARGIRPGKFLLGVGRLTPEKGFEYLIEAAGALPQVEQVVIAGGSDHDTAYFEKLKSLDTGHKVVFTGFTSGEDLRQLYSHARLFVLPSLNEGFPLVMLEAMSYELPMVVSDITATHLVNLPAADYFVAGEVDSMVRTIAGKLEQAGQPSVSYDLNQFDWERVARLTRQQYGLN